MFDNINSGDPLAQRCSPQARSPQDRHAIRYGEVSTIQYIAECSVFAGEAQKVEVDRYDLARNALLDKDVDQRDGLRQPDIVDGRIQHATRRQRVACGM